VTREEAKTAGEAKAKAAAAGSWILGSTRDDLGPSLSSTSTFI